MVVTKEIDSWMVKGSGKLWKPSGPGDAGAGGLKATHLLGKLGQDSYFFVGSCIHSRWMIIGYNTEKLSSRFQQLCVHQLSPHQGKHIFKNTQHTWSGHLYFGEQSYYGKQIMFTNGLQLLLRGNRINLTMT